MRLLRLPRVLRLQLAEAAARFLTVRATSYARWSWCGAEQAPLLGRTDVTTPLNTLDAVAVRPRCLGERVCSPEVLAGVQEGVALQALGLSPYAGSFLHAPPLLFALLGAACAALPRHPPCDALASPGTVEGQHPAVEVLPFVAADAISAALLYRLSRVHASGKGDAAAGRSSWGCALLFLCNPCAIAACIGCAICGNARVFRGIAY